MSLSEHIFVARSTNIKVGDVPHMYIGRNEKQCVDSCKKSKCPLLSKRYGGDNGLLPSGTKLKPCYAHNGTVSFAVKAIYKAISRGKASNYTLAHALKKSVRSARIMRISQIGDPCAVTKDDADSIYAECKKVGLQLKGFTAGWRIAPWWKGKLMASTMSLHEADEAIARGWRASTVLSEDFVGSGPKNNTFVTPGGNKGVVCPHQMGARLTCNTCRLCVGENEGPIIGFITHR